MTNQFAKDIFQDYRKQAQQVANQWVQLKNRNPYTEFPQLAAEVNRLSLLAVYWGTTAYRLAKAARIQQYGDEI